MKFWEKFKKGFGKSSKQVAKTTEELLEKSKKLGDEGWDSIKDILSQIGDKASDVSEIVKLKLKLESLNTRFNAEFLELGKIILTIHRNGEDEVNKNLLTKQLEKMAELEDEQNKLNHEYDKLRKTLSDGYVVNKLKNDLADSGIIIEQVMVSEKSNVVNKYLKEILLPKEALVSAIKRDQEIIIPDGNTQFLSNDLVTVFGKNEDVSKIVKRLSAA